MVTNFIHPSVPSLHKKLDREVSHRLAVILFTDGDGYGYGVVEGRTGNCFAWDGMYLHENMPSTTPLDELDWAEWDDMSSKLVFQTQRDWLAGPLGFWLMPSYSVAKEAAELVSSWGDDRKGEGRHHAGSTLRCYLPVTDEAAYEAHLAAEEERNQRIRSRMSGGQSAV
ncbi:hypothetical protein LO763_22165 [Glycomyces sp. A-F 0318]|uniref:hypothetical protein n=1 Tax=Glycomyces amatae TaxID=2881355 RepID=UPI001E498848|nr:hypothetical protein [Glycomyces amatae]MCD0446323.1 hypothetical protein [Glycomyces amatae]